MRRACIMLLALAAGCGADGGATLIVQLRTDMVPGVEFSGVRTAVVQGRRSETETSAAFLDQDFREARRVAEIDGLRAASLDLRVDLLGPRGEAVLGRSVRVAAGAGRTVVTVVITRSCRDVVCPNDGSPEATECLGGRCVPPECSELDPEACGAPECTSATECSSATACVVPACEEGSCLELPGECGAGRYCQPGVGCAARPMDAGVAIDAGPDLPTDAALPDAGPTPPDAGPTSPDAGPTPRDAGPMPPDTGPPPMGPCVGVPAGTTCRAARDPICDPPELCDGASPDCPPDIVAPTSVRCRDVRDDCDVADDCDGFGGCPDAVRTATHVCRALVGPCDTSERCDGVTPACPPDARAPDGSMCNVTCGDELCMGGVCVNGRTCTGGNVCICDFVCASPTTPCPR